MAVMRHSIIFGGVDSADYGIYIGGEGTFNAPKRDVEMITVPGRNGTFALDRGRFENIEVTYPAFNFEPDLATFSANLEAFRNAICSQKWYQRLTDSFHPDEYRMAAYIDGLEIKPISYNTASEFELTFDCMPQRYLTSGETAISVSDGQTLVNPTLFESSPLLEFDGYGSIGINGETVTVSNGALGVIPISSAVNTANTRLDVSNLNVGDSIINTASSMPEVKAFITADWGSMVTPARVLNVSGGTATIGTQAIGTYVVTVVPTVTSFVNGTSATATAQLTIDIWGENYRLYETFEVVVTYDAIARTITLAPRFVNGQPSAVTCSYTYKHPAYYGISSKTVLPSRMYIDLDIGEAYGELDGVVTSFNSITTMPAKLPTLKAGPNTISFDGTMSNVKITPRWWKI